MLITAAIAKLHRVKVTQAELDYIGSITIDRDLLVASGIQPYQQVHINNLANGEHWETYVLEGPAGKGDICLNGPPALLFHPGDIVIIVAYAQIEPSELKNLKPLVVFVDDKNKITEIKKHDLIPIGATDKTV
jgi:aspartate 1-decarboxylase